MKKTISLLLALFAISTVSAQNDNMTLRNVTMSNRRPIVIGFGPRIGLNITTITGDGAADRTFTPGIMVGGTINLRTSKWFSLSLDVLYSSQGYKVKNVKSRETLSYVIAPVLANFHVIERLSIQTGLQPSVMVGAMLITEDGKTSTKDNWKTFDLTLPVGISYKISHAFELDLRYNIGLTNLSTQDNLRLKTSGFSLSFGYKF